MKKIIIFAVLIISAHSMIFSDALSRTYEPPINFFFIIHVEPMAWGTGTTYDERMANLEVLMDMISAYEPASVKFTILMNGDFTELVMSNGDSALFAGFQNAGHELGSHNHGLVHIAPFEWVYPELTCRYGQPVFNYESTHQSWYDVSSQIDRLTNEKHSICASPFLCSNEAQLADEFGYTCTPGDRSEKCLDYTDKLIRHPLRPAANDMYGHELEEDLNSSIIYLDHYAQFGKENAHGYNCTFDTMTVKAMECYQEWLDRESSDLDSLDYYVWTFGVLTHLHLLDDNYYEQIGQWLEFMDENFINRYTPRGNLIGRYATSWEVAQEYIQWEAVHPNWSSFNYIHPYPHNLVINEIMYNPEMNETGKEWIEIFNPTDEIIDISGWKISNADIYTYWSIPEGIVEPGEYKVFANDGQVFFEMYGFYPDYEETGGTQAIDIIENGDMELHVIGDAVVLKDTTTNAPMSELNWVDVYSWGSSWHAGFCDTTTTDEGHTIARDSSSTDSDLLQDWEQDGRHASEPTPGRKNITYLSVNLTEIVPVDYEFKGNYPNPFNASTTFSFSQPVRGEVSISVYDISGRLTMNKKWGMFEPGTHFVQISLGDFSSGIYPYVFEIGDKSNYGKMLFIK